MDRQLNNNGLYSSNQGAAPLTTEHTYLPGAAPTLPMDNKSVPLATGPISTQAPLPEDSKHVKKGQGLGAKLSAAVHQVTAPLHHHKAGTAESDRNISAPTAPRGMVTTMDNSPLNTTYLLANTLPDSLPAASTSVIAGPTLVETYVPSSVVAPSAQIQGSAYSAQSLQKADVPSSTLGTQNLQGAPIVANTVECTSLKNSSLPLASSTLPASNLSTTSNYSAASTLPASNLQKSSLQTSSLQTSTLPANVEARIETNVFVGPTTTSYSKGDALASNYDTSKAVAVSNEKVLSSVTEVKHTPIVDTETRILPEHKIPVQSERIIPEQRIAVQSERIIPEKKIAVESTRVIPEQRIPVTETKIIPEKHIPVTELKTVPEQRIPLGSKKEIKETSVTTTTEKQILETPARVVDSSIRETTSTLQSSTLPSSSYSSTTTTSSTLPNSSLNNNSNLRR